MVILIQIIFYTRHSAQPIDNSSEKLFAVAFSAETQTVLSDILLLLLRVDDETAFYFGIITPQAIRFNPTSMEITGTVSYPEAIREGFDFTQRCPLQRGNQIFCVVGHGIPDVSFGVAPGVDMVILDIQTSTVQITSDSRGVGYIEFTTLGPDNAVYVANILSYQASFYLTFNHSHFS
ncbi:MAG: hypothetical protein AAGI25_13375 [Bacteroidota bacterium]